MDTAFWSTRNLEQLNSSPCPDPSKLHATFGQLIPKEDAVTWTSGRKTTNMIAEVLSAHYICMIVQM